MSDTMSQKRLSDVNFAGMGSNTFSIPFKIVLEWGVEKAPVSGCFHASADRYENVKK